jgi:hypothetical protein
MGHPGTVMQWLGWFAREGYFAWARLHARFSCIAHNDANTSRAASGSKATRREMVLWFFWKLRSGCFFTGFFFITALESSTVLLCCFLGKHISFLENYILGKHACEVKGLHWLPIYGYNLMVEKWTMDLLMLTYYLCTGHVRTYLDLDGNNTDGDGAIYVSNFWKQATF